MRASLVPLLACSALLGCGSVHHSTQNLPGHIVVEERPKDLRQRKPETPKDPGEHVVLWNAGLLGGGGVRLTPERPGTGSLSFETSARWGWTDRSHLWDETIVPLDSPPTATSLGVNLGWTVGTEGRPARNAGYAELQYTTSHVISLAAGWAWDPWRQLSGPQLTASLGPFYARSSTMLTSGTALEAGLVLKMPVFMFTERR